MMKPQRLMTIPKDILLREYRDNVLRVIANKYGVSETTVHRLLNDYGIPKITLQDRNDSSVKVTQCHREILIGGLLGDSSIRKTDHNNPVYVVSNGHKQMNYVIWKHAHLRELTHFVEPKQNSTNEAYYFNTMSLSFVERLWEKWYADGVKSVPENIQEHLSPLALAIWHMDDGWLRRDAYQVILCTDCFSVEEINLLQDALRKRYDIESRIFKTSSGKKTFGNGDYYRLRLNAEDAKAFLAIIEKHVPACMRYKVDRSLATTVCLGDLQESVIQSGLSGNRENAAEMTASIKEVMA